MAMRNFIRMEKQRSKRKMTELKDVQILSPKDTAIKDIGHPQPPSERQRVGERKREKRERGRGEERGERLCKHEGTQTLLSHLLLPGT